MFSTAYHPFIGGAEVAIQEITNRLEGEFAFDLITARLDPKLPKEEKVGTITVHRIGLGWGAFDKLSLPILGALKISKLHHKQPFFLFWGVMVTFATGAPFVWNILRKITWRETLPVVITLQEGDSEAHLTHRYGGLIGYAWKKAMKNADVVTAISSYLGNRAKEWGFKGGPFIIPNGVDFKRFDVNFSEEQKKNLRKKWGIEKGDIALVTTSRLSKKNNLSAVIHSLVFLPAEVHFIIAGIGEEERSLREIASTLNVSQRVHFIGFVGQDDVPALLKASDIFIRPSLSEGMGNSFIEAMAAELPVIATPVGGIVDFLFDPDQNPHTQSTGLFCDPHEPQSIAKQVRRYLEHPALREQIILEAKKMVKEKYDWDDIAQDMKEKGFTYPVLH